MEDRPAAEDLDALHNVRVVAKHDDRLFRKIIDFSRERYDTDKATYHVSAEVGKVPAPKDVKDVQQLERLYLERWDDVAADFEELRK